MPIRIVTEHELADLGYRRSWGTPKGQRADYRRPLDDGRGLHVRVYEGQMTVHWDRTAPSVNLLAHLFEDARGITLTAGGSTVLAVGALLWL